MAAILVIDDDPQVRLALRLMLREAGHVVHEAADGAEGLRLFHAEPPDLILCDLYMDRKEGLETIRELRRLDPAVKLIALSGDASLFKFARAFGATETLPKPFSRDALLACVQGVLARPG